MVLDKIKDEIKKKADNYIYFSIACNYFLIFSNL